MLVVHLSLRVAVIGVCACARPDVDILVAMRRRLLETQSKLRDTLGPALANRFTPSYATRALFNTSSFIGVVWVAYVIYRWFDTSGIWLTVDNFLSGTRDNPFLTLLICIFIGWVPIAATAWSIWFVFLRGRNAADFPEAKLRK